jgi:CheY-like chemotaxis protein
MPDARRRPPHLLIVDDDAISRRGIRRALTKAALDNTVFEAKDGAEALDLLRGRTGRSALPRPITVLLDLKMPRMNGFEFLDELRADPDLTVTNVFVMSTSDAAEDKQAAYRQHVAGYIVKDGEASGFTEAAQMLDRYWQVVELP